MTKRVDTPDAAVSPAAQLETETEAEHGPGTADSPSPVESIDDPLFEAEINMGSESEEMEDFHRREVSPASPADSSGNRIERAHFKLTQYLTMASV